MKRFTSLLLLVILLVSSGALGLAEQAASVINFEEEPYTLVVCYPVLSEAQPDLALIEEAINEITLREINARVQFEAISLFSTANVLALKASGQEKMDLVALMPGYSYLAAFATNRMIRPIDAEIDAWGQDIKAALGDALAAGLYKAQQYAIPQNKDFLTNGYGYQLNVPLAEKHGIDISAIETLEDLEAAFAIIHENEPDVIVITPEQSGGTIVTSVRGKIDSLGSTVTRLEVAEDGTLKVVSSYADEEYLSAAIKVREWYEKGYISRDVTTAQESGSQLMWGGKAFSTAAPSLGASMGGIGNGTEYRSVMFDSLMCSTIDSQMTIWTIPSWSERPDKAVQFINLAYASEEIGNLFRYGIEGNHHSIREDGAAKLENTAGWQNNWFLLGDYNKMLLRTDAIDSAGVTYEGFEQLAADWNASVTMSPAYGFIFDPASVRTEIAACDAVIDEYGKAIGNGAVDPVTEVPKFVQALEDAGVQTIVDEVQRQLDEWVANQA